jgi:GNAT superfamily N-acetyltransferase
MQWIIEGYNGGMKIKKIDPLSKKDRLAFANFPFELYRQVPQWVPPLAGTMENVLLPTQHPFYQHSQVDFYVAESEGDVLGRVAAIHNRNHNAYRNARTAFFGFFEVVEDIQVSRALLETVFSWAKKRNLMEVIGPRGMIGSDSGGILVEGFDKKPALGVPYNLPYYDSYLVDSGFRKDTDHLSGYLPGNHPLPSRILRIAERTRQRGKFWIKTFTKKSELRSWVPRVAEVHSQAFIHNHEYFPPTPQELALIANTIISVSDPRLIKLAMLGEKVVGFVLAYHDLSAAIQKCKGKVWPLGWYWIFQERRRADWVNVNGIGVLPELRGKGVDTLLIAELAQSIYAIGFKNIEVIQVNETNFESRSDMEAIGVTWYKRHRNYRASNS